MKCIFDVDADQARSSGVEGEELDSGAWPLLGRAQEEGALERWRAYDMDQAG